MMFLQGVNLDKVMEAGDFICSALNRKTNSKVSLARNRKLWYISATEKMIMATNQNTGELWLFMNRLTEQQHVMRKVGIA